MSLIRGGYSAACWRGHACNQQNWCRRKWCDYGYDCSLYALLERIQTYCSTLHLQTDFQSHAPAMAWFRPVQRIVMRARFACFLPCLFKFHICRFRRAAVGINQQRFVCFNGIADIVKGFFQRSVDRMVLCNAHISPSRSRSAAISFRYISLVEFTCFAI